MDSDSTSPLRFFKQAYLTRQRPLARAAAVLVGVLLAVGLHFLARPWAGETVHLFFFLPVMLAALLYGSWAGLFTALLAAPFDLLFLHGGNSLSVWEYLQSGVGAGLLSLMIAGWVVGKQRDHSLHMQTRLDVQSGTEAVLRESEQRFRALTLTAQRQARELALLNQVYSIVAREMDLNVLFRTVVESTAEAFKYRLVSIYLLQGETLFLEHEVGYVEPVLQMPPGKGITQQVVRSGEAALVADVSKNPDFYCGDASIDSEVCVPLSFQGKVIGVFNIESDSSMQLTEADLRLMSQLAQFVEVGIERAYLYSAEREQRELAEALYDTAQALNSSLQLDDVLDSILTNLDKVVTCDAAGIILYLSGRRRLRVRRSGAAASTEVDLPDGFEVESLRPMRQMLEQGRPVIVENFSQETAAIPSIGMAWLRSALGAPIFVQGSPAGYLILGSGKDGFFEEKHCDRLRLFAEQARAAIDNARLVLDLQRQAQQMAQLYEITSLSINTLGVNDIFQGLTDRLGKLIGADGTYIARWDETRQQAILVASSGSLQNKYSAMAVETGEATIVASVMQLGQAVAVVDVHSSPYIHPRVAQHFPNRSVLGLPLIADGRKLGAVLLGFEREHHFTADEISLCEQAAGQAALAVTKALLVARIEQMALTDELTGLYNHRGVTEFGRREVERSIRFNRPLSAIMIDIDHFKLVNDRFGHPLGNQTLRVMAERCRSNVREIDILGRYGGEEFLVLLPENDLAAARQVAERLRAIIADMAIHTGQGDIRITASMGVAEMSADVHELNELIERADQALYRAKHAGRNRVSVYGSGD